MADARRRTGQLGEEAAAAHLERRGWSLVERNARTARGEIDLIALAGATLVFVEVKSRRAGGRVGPATPLESIDPRKQLRIRRLARAWIADRPRALSYSEIRFDAIAVAIGPDGTPVSIDHVEGAF